MLICRYAEGVDGQRKVTNPWHRGRFPSKGKWCLVEIHLLSV